MKSLWVGLSLWRRSAWDYSALTTMQGLSREDNGKGDLLQQEGFSCCTRRAREEFWGGPAALTPSFHPIQPSLSLATITDEEMKTGDPQETLRRASMQPAQIAEGMGITTRQQRKRVSSEPHQGPGTPEVGDPDSCFVPSSRLLSPRV